MNKYPEIPIVVIDHRNDNDLGVSMAVASGKYFLAMCITNPQLRADGETEHDAITRLKHLIKSTFGGDSIAWDGSRQKQKVKYTTVTFDDELVEEVMDE